MDPNPQYPNKHQEFEAIDLKAWLFRMTRLWPWFVGFMGISMLSAWFYLVNTERIYQSDATLLIKDDRKTGSNSMDNNVLKALNISGSGKLLENEIEVLKSTNLLWEVVLLEQLYVTIKQEKKFADITLYGGNQPFELEVSNPDTIFNSLEWLLDTRKQPWILELGIEDKNMQVLFGNWYIVNGIRFRFRPKSDLLKGTTRLQPVNDLYRIHFNNPVRVAQQYKKNLDIKQVGKQSTVISLSVKDLHYERGNAFLRSLISLYNLQGLNDKNLTTANTINFLEERLAVVEKELRLVETDVERFKKINKVTDMPEQSKMLMDMVSDIDRQKAIQESQVNVIAALEKELSQNQDNPRMVPSTLGVTDISAASLIEKHNQLLQQRDRMINLAGKQNPALIDLNNQVREIRQGLLENIRNLKKAYAIELGDIQARDRRISDRLVNIPALEKQLLEISRDRNVKQQIYLFLLQKREESAIALASSVTDGRTVESPQGTKQIHPMPAVTYGIAGLVGLFLAIIPMLLIDFLDDRVGNMREVTNKCHAPVLGEMNHVKQLSNPIQIGPKSRNVISEQIRAIRTNISFTGNGHAVRTILVTSHVPGEGKSFTSLNIAASYALLDKKVVVLEFDLRKPRLLRSLGLTAQKGISNYLSGQVELNDLFIPIEGYAEHLYVLPSGPIPPNPSELILGTKMHELIRKLTERFDYIIIDSPPFSLVTDALLLKQFVDLTIVVLRQGYSSKSSFREINEKLLDQQDSKVYIILNGINKSLRYSYYTAKYANEYGYGYGYGGNYGSEYFEKS
jgi:capsular exopolysaccharide synthesis family protein